MEKDSKEYEREKRVCLGIKAKDDKGTQTYHMHTGTHTQNTHTHTHTRTHKRKYALLISLLLLFLRGQVLATTEHEETTVYADLGR